MVEIWRPIQDTAPILNCCRGGYYREGKWVSVSQSYGFVWKFAE